MKKTIPLSILLLISLTLTLTAFPVAHSATSDVKIVSYSYYIDNYGYLDVVGEVQNIGVNTLSRVVLSGVVTTSTATTPPILSPPT